MDGQLMTGTQPSIAKSIEKLNSLLTSENTQFKIFLLSSNIVIFNGYLNWFGLLKFFDQYGFSKFKKNQDLDVNY